AERDPAAANLDVTLPHRRDSEGLVGVRIAVVADPKPPEIDQAYRECARPLRRHRLVLHVLRHRFAERRQRVGEPNQLVELRLLLRGPVIVVIAVLPPACRIGTCCLQLRARTRRDPDVFPRRRDRERLDPRELPGVGDAPTARVEVAEMPARAYARPSTFPGHDAGHCRWRRLVIPLLDSPRPWMRSGSSCSRETRPARSCSKRRLECSLLT